MPAPLARLLAAEGFTALPAQYRLLDQAAFPAAVHDVKAAIRWVRANAAELGVEPDRIALCSNSAGAHLSLLAAGTQGTGQFEGEGENGSVSAEVNAVAVFYPPTAFRAGGGKQRGTVPADALLGDGATAEAAREASPLTYVSPAFPPTFFLHGSADRVVPASSSVLMHEALRAAGVETDLHVYAGQNHGFDHVDVFREVVVKEIALFFGRTVSQKAEIAQRILDQSMFAQRAAAEAAAAGEER